MRLREKGKKDAEPVTMGWDQAQAALAAGTHQSAEGDGDDRMIGGPDADDADLDGMTRADLDKIAADRGIDASQAKNKDDVIKAIRAA